MITKEELSRLLIAAVTGGYIKVVKALILEGADVNAKGHREKTALMFASEEGRIEIAEALIKAGADVNAKSYFKDTIKILTFQVFFINWN